ncbi:DUF2147 domain-containing protein [Flavihumibacter stibioxidans]|uniref:DUF2147 domain-containing protein n=1 Tax=Flavihumibacter stibioxidans TaxID=1834163 RepID=A0ABR7M4H2_9BACT|nr:DUF2147 domain-containing protein [Flavihumibacter stibioxidans]MBC6489640.1 hypothetical protein [Flavihumibacter stibioxidans]
MKYVALAAIIVSMTSFKTPKQYNADKIVGKWLANEDKNVIVQIYKSGNEYKAKIVWFDDSDDKARPMATRCDSKNPDKSLRNRKLLGLEVLTGLTYNADEEEWQGGHIYDPSSGKEYAAKAWLTTEGMLKVRGYWHFEIFGQNMCFTKTN